MLRTEHGKFKGICIGGLKRRGGSNNDGSFEKTIILHLVLSFVIIVFFVVLTLHWICKQIR